MREFLQALCRDVAPTPFRVSLRIAFLIRKYWRKRFGQPERGCSILARNPEGKVLFVRHSYVEPDTWMLPAGRFSKTETPVEGALRELFEEVGMQPSDVFIYEFEDAEYWDINYRTYMVEAAVAQAPQIDMREVIAAAFFDPRDLPENVSLATRERIERWLYRQSFVVDAPAFVRPQYLEMKGIARRLGS